MRHGSKALLFRFNNIEICSNINYCWAHIHKTLCIHYYYVRFSTSQKKFHLININVGHW